MAGRRIGDPEFTHGTHSNVTGTLNMSSKTTKAKEVNPDCWSIFPSKHLVTRKVTNQTQHNNNQMARALYL